MKQRWARILLYAVLVGWCLLFLRCETTEKSMIRVIYLEQKEQTWSVGLLYQSPEAAADAADASAALRIADGRGQTSETALAAAEAALPQTADYRLCDYVLFPEQTEDAVLAAYENLVLERGCGRTAARLSAMDYAELTGKETVIDAYCGTGTIGLIAARNAKRVIGVELNKDAVKDARINAKENGIKNAEIYAGDAGRFMVDMASKNQKADVVFMDPPRAGSDEKFLSSVIKLGPKRVVYVSCNPETLARDLKYLTGNGYQAMKIQPVDNFPFCDHIETVVKLVKKR